MNKEKLINLLLLFSNYRFPAKGKTQRKLFLSQFKKSHLEYLYFIKLNQLRKIQRS